MSFVTVELLDEKGVRNPKAENNVSFDLEGPGTIVGVGNANPICTESSNNPIERHGRAAAWWLSSPAQFPAS